ncbi:MAG: hypothetical protein WBS20_17455 [Lysobacterales bacterium]
MKTRPPPKLVSTENLVPFFLSSGIAHTTAEPLALGFGNGNDQYRLYPYPGPADDETMGVFCEWHTEDYFEVDTGPHVAIGMRGPAGHDPHRGRGLAIGILANRMANPDDPDNSVRLFNGCPDPPGGPAFFIEDFTVCDGTTPVRDWQLSAGQHLPGLKGYGVYRIDIHVSRQSVWAGVWQVTGKRPGNVDLFRGDLTRAYVFLGETFCPDPAFEPGGSPAGWCCEDPLDRGRGNAFIGTGFSDPQTRSRIENIHIAHWKNPV